MPAAKGKTVETPAVMTSDDVSARETNKKQRLMMQSDDDNQSPSKNALAPTDPLQVEAKSITDLKVHSSTTRSYSKSAHPTKCAHLTRTLCNARPTSSGGATKKEA